MNDVSCDEQRPIFKQKLDAVLVIGEPPALVKPSSNPYMFSIVGWKEGTQPGGTPSSQTQWVSPDVRLVSGHASNGRFRGQEIYSHLPPDLRIDCQSQNSKLRILHPRETPKLDSNQRKIRRWLLLRRRLHCHSRQSPHLIHPPKVTTLTDKHQNMDQSRTVFSIDPCNGSQPVDFHMVTRDEFELMYKTSAEFAGNRTRANGTFDGTSATLSIGGHFSGSFLNWHGGYYSSTSNKLKYGTYKLKFSGDLDRPHSHELSTSGQTPSWTENRDLLPGGSKANNAAAAGSTACVGGASAVSAGSRAEVGRAIFGLAALGGLIVVGMGIVLW